MTDLDQSSNDQLAKWLDGVSEHNIARDECVPDFSCCEPHLLAPIAERRLFCERPELRMSLLMGFLGRALSGTQAYVAGSVDGEA